MSKKKSGNKIYIRVDKPIEVGDLVRCVRGDGEYKSGDIRKVSRLGMNSKNIFYTFGSGKPHWQSRWEPVHKLAIGDQVVFGGKDILTVKELSPDAGLLTVKRWYDEFKLFVTDQFELYQPEKHDPKPVRKEVKMSENRRAEMEQEVAEMIVELLEKDSNDGHMSLHVYSTSGLTHAAGSLDLYRATLAPNDTWDTLTGVFVALSKAAGRKLPDWIYGEER